MRGTLRGTCTKLRSYSPDLNISETEFVEPRISRILVDDDLSNCSR